MSQRTIKAAVKRTEQRLNKMQGFARTGRNNVPEDRAEALSTIKRIKVVRG